MHNDCSTIVFINIYDCFKCYCDFENIFKFSKTTIDGHF